MRLPLQFRRHQLWSRTSLKSRKKKETTCCSVRPSIITIKVAKRVCVYVRLAFLSAFGQPRERLYKRTDRWTLNESLLVTIVTIIFTPFHLGLLLKKTDSPEVSPSFPQAKQQQQLSPQHSPEYHLQQQQQKQQQRQQHLLSIVRSSNLNIPSAGNASREEKGGKELVDASDEDKNTRKPRDEILRSVLSTSDAAQFISPISQHQQQQQQQQKLLAQATQHPMSDTKRALRAAILNHSKSQSPNLALPNPIRSSPQVQSIFGRIVIFNFLVLE